MARTTVRAPMPASRRAKQFAPFDALKGLKEAIAEKERIPTPRRILAEDALAELNQKISQLRKGTIVTVVYYCIYEQEYHQICISSVLLVWFTTGRVKGAYESRRRSGKKDSKNIQQLFQGRKNEG